MCMVYKAGPPWLNINTVFRKYVDIHYKDETVLFLQLDSEGRIWRKYRCYF